ncbi:MAG: hypothetical protein ACP5RV_12200 [Thiomonas sp.]
MISEQTIQDVAMIARSGIDRVIELERGNASLLVEVKRLRELSDEMFSAMTAALLLAPHSSGAYSVLDEATKSIQSRWIRRAAADHQFTSMES